MSGLRLEVPSALDYFSSLVAEDEGFALLEAAVCVGQDEVPELDVQQVLMQIDALALRLRQRIPSDAAPLQRLRLLNRFFFHELGFGGNVNNYYDARNSYLHEVLVSRRGIPISLALLYLEFAHHAGLEARGVSFPGHFLVKLRLPRGEVVIDPFSGLSLSREELEERLAPYRRQRGLVGDFEAPLGLFLQAAPSRDILARLLRNLKEIHRASEDFERLLAVQQRLVILLPQAWEERRDRGLALAELGADDLAAQDLAVYLEHCGSADDAPALFARLTELRGAGSHRLH
ncbi:MAG: tetratricopeptide repeat protein [Rubrivivax sp.]|nr:tetratricopeptide repeat protein [Rubrivivax sp.]